MFNSLCLDPDKLGPISRDDCINSPLLDPHWAKSNRDLSHLPSSFCSLRINVIPKYSHLPVPMFIGIVHPPPAVSGIAKWYAPGDRYLGVGLVSFDPGESMVEQPPFVITNLQSNHIGTGLPMNGDSLKG